MSLQLVNMELVGFKCAQYDFSTEYVQH